MNLRVDRPNDRRCDAACCSDTYSIRYAAGATELNEDQLRMCERHYLEFLAELERFRLQTEASAPQA